LIVPYIDENGFQYSLLSNADGRNIVVGSNADLFVGQTVYLNSSTQSPTARAILNIAPLSQTSFLLTLDGLPNLDVFRVADSAYIQAYLPGTVNSQNVIFIPSDIQTPDYDQINIPSSVANVNLVGLSKVDWLLDPYGDLAVTNTGDFRLAAGITNLIQALTIKFNTKINTCLLNPDFGLAIKVGTMNSDTSASDIYNEIVNLITTDPRFSGISGLQVNLSGPTLGINLGIGLAGVQGVFPVGFTLPSTA
jgi:fluoride ion exporter CrcB/FEX